jgi:uncharacterized membrane protein
VSEETRVILIFILVVILMLTLAFLGSTLLMKRALKTVIKSFRDKEALNQVSAKEAAELGIKRKGFLQVQAFRDYKPSAIQFLQRQDIVMTTEEGKLYLSEEALLQSGLEEKLKKMF